MVSQISNDASVRPDAVTISLLMRNTLPSLACDACAKSEIPGNSSQKSSRMHVHRREGSAQSGATAPATRSNTGRRWSELPVRRPSSFQSPRPNLGGFDQIRALQRRSRDDSTASCRSGSADSSAVSDHLTRHDSAATTQSETWHMRANEEHDFETTLLSYSIEQGEAAHRIKESGISDGTLRLILYRSVCEQAWEVTRRMVIIDPDNETQTTRIFSNWLPLADMTMCLYDDTVIMSWSDCNHDVQEPTRNYVESHSKRYDPGKHNNKLVLKVASAATANARGLIQALCSPICVDGRALRQPRKQMRLMSGESVGFFPALHKEQNDMMMIVGDLEQGATTKIYSIPNQLNLSVAASRDSVGSQQLFQAVISGLLTTSYESDAQHLSKMMEKKGFFDKAVQTSRKAVFTFAESTALFDFMEAVTGWNLVLLTRLRSVKEKRKLTHDCGSGELLLWQKRSKTGGPDSMVMTFRLHREGGIERWISGIGECREEGES